jgi:hypothetical protein
MKDERPNMTHKQTSTSSIRLVMSMVTAVFSLSFPTGALSQGAALVAPEFNVPAMNQAWERAPVSCRKAVKRVLKSYNFYDGPIDASWNEATLAGIKQYTAGGQNLDFNSVSYLGSLGLIYHMGHPEKSCVFPEIE